MRAEEESGAYVFFTRNKAKLVFSLVKCVCEFLTWRVFLRYKERNHKREMLGILCERRRGLRDAVPIISHSVTVNNMSEKKALM